MSSLELIGRFHLCIATLINRRDCKLENSVYLETDLSQKRLIESPLSNFQNNLMLRRLGRQTKTNAASK